MTGYKTGRTEQVNIKITKEIKSQIKYMFATNNQFNLAVCFENMWKERFISTKEELHLEKEKHLQEINKINDKLHDLRTKELFEATLILTEENIKTLLFIANKFIGDDQKQMEMFCVTTNHKLQGVPHYLALRNKYYNVKYFKKYMNILKR